MHTIPLPALAVPLPPVAVGGTSAALPHTPALPASLRDMPGLQLQFSKGAVLFRPSEPAETLFLVRQGRVKLARVADDGRESVIDILSVGDTFGELALFGQRVRHEQASALDDVAVTRWGVEEVRRVLQTDPQMATWLAGLLGQRLEAARDHVQTLSFDPIPKRLARVLLEHVRRFGTGRQDGWVRILPLTHEALAQQVATSREIITHYMIEFRERGILQYSRKAIDVRPDQLTALLR